MDLSQIPQTFHTTTLFHLIISKNTIKATNYAKTNKINPNQQNHQNDTALTLACNNNMEELALTLLTYKSINLNIINNNLDTPLLCAIKNNLIRAALTILSLHNATINPNHQNIYNESALLLACKIGHANLIQTLLTTFPTINPNLPSLKGEYPLTIACSHNVPINDLLAHPSINPNVQNKNLDTPLIIACKKGSSKSVTLLLNHKKTDSDISDASQRTPIIWACLNLVIFNVAQISRNKSAPLSERTIVKIIKILIDCPRVNLNHQDENGDTPLIILADYYTEKIALIIQRYSEIQLVNNENNNALIVACMHRASNLAIILIKYKLLNVINHVNSFGETALMWACKNKMCDVANELLDVIGIQIHHVDTMGKRARDYAFNQGLSNIVRRIDDVGANPMGIIGKSRSGILNGLKNLD